MKLYEIGGNPETGQENQAQRSLIAEELRVWCPLLDVVEFYPIVGNADTPYKSSTADGGGERDLNQPFANNEVDPSYGSIALKIFGGKIQVDDAHVRRAANADPKVVLASLRLREIKQFARRVGQNLQYAIVNNDSSDDAKKWDGLLTAAPASRTVAFASDTSTDAKIKNLIRAIKTGLDDIPGGPGFILMDSELLGIISSYASTLVQMGMNELGEQIRTIDTVPVVLAGRNSAGDKVLPWTWTNNSTKILIGRSSEAADIAFASNVGLVVKDLGLIDPHWTTKVEFDIDMDILNDESIYVIEDIRANA